MQRARTGGPVVPFPTTHPPPKGGRCPWLNALALSASAFARSPVLSERFSSPGSVAASTLHDMDANGLLASLFISSIGMVTFLYGKKQSRVPHLAIGLTLVVYTYFLSSVAWMFAIAAVLLALLWFVVRLGW
jgi:hypothetical protein